MKTPARQAQPGPALDEAVARVMGSRHLEYSQNWEAVGAVIDSLPDGHNFALQKWMDCESEPPVFGWSADMWAGVNVGWVTAEAETAQIAICRVFLLANGVEEVEDASRS